VSSSFRVTRISALSSRTTLRKVFAVATRRSATHIVDAPARSVNRTSLQCREAHPDDRHSRAVP
jgi:hypothetical protein